MGFYQRLGVKTYITCGSNGTANGGSIMFPQVLEAMAEASRSFIRLSDLHEKAGHHLAELIGVEAAYITSGAAAGVTLAVAACLTGKDWGKVHRLPDLPGAGGQKPEVIIQVMQRNYYELMIRLAGAKIVEVGLANATNAWHLEAAITERTAAIVHFVAYSPPTDLPLESVIEIGHRHGIPVIVDGAAEFPPFSILRHYTDMGADLAIFSGGKGIRGPQSSGLILGKRELIEACAMNGSPFHGVGRPMKVGKEEIAGLVTALELWADPEFERRQVAEWEQCTSRFIELMSGVRGLRVSRGVSPPPSSGRALNPSWVPLAHMEWDSGAFSLTPLQVADQLRREDPGILIPAISTGLMFSPQCIEAGEEVIIAERVKAVLQPAQGSAERQ
jgi:L-seryl-tRNA(Ser) seleniumtransferase